MTISDAQFSAWLKRDRARVVLVEAEAYSGGSVVTRYLSNRGFVSTPSDTPASIAYRELLTEVPRITSKMAEALRGRSLISYGDLNVDNSGGELDAWLLDAWEARPLRLYLGDPSWPKADFRLVFDGCTADIRARDNRTLTLKLRDRQYLLDVPLQTTLIGGTGPAKDQRRPACYGEVKQIEPVLIDAATRTYAWHDGQVQGVDAVYQNGVAIATYTADNTAGTITLTAALTGRLTLDGKGSKTGGVYVNKTADIMARIVAERTAFPSGDIDATTFGQVNTDVPGPVGLYIGRDSTTVIGALDALANGIGGYYHIGRDGKLRVGQLKAPGGTPVLTLGDDDLQLGRIELLKRLLPMSSVRVGYERYWTVIDTAATTATEAARQRLSDGYLVAKATNTITGHLQPVEGNLEPSCFVASADASTEATRRAALYAVIRRVFRIDGFAAAQQVQLGDVIALNFSRYGLGGGALATIVGIDENITGGAVGLEVFL